MSMSIEEAIYCLESYQPGTPNDMCEKCPYYKSVIENKNGKEYYTCKSSEARRIAIKSLKIYLEIFGKKSDGNEIVIYRRKMDES